MTLEELTAAASNPHIEDADVATIFEAIWDNGSEEAYNAAVLILKEHRPHILRWYTHLTS